VHAEAILTYGLPVNYRAMLVKFNKKNERRLRDALAQLYAHLGRADGSGADDSVPVAAALPGQSAEYFPYVTYPINMELIK
jgi:V-type H+-transporting ATPase subunit C